MGRRKKKRFVRNIPKAVLFKPQGVPMRELERQVISIEGFEALRLVDCEGMQQQEASDLMGVSRPTLSRVLSEARKAVATALSKGWAIQIEGGEYHCLSEPCPKKYSESETTITTGGNTMPGFNGTGQRGSGTGRGQRRQGCGQGGGQGGGQGQGRGLGQGGGQGSGIGRGLGRGMAAGQGGGQANLRQPQSGSTVTKSTLPKTKGSTVTKVAVSSEGPTLDHRVDPRFGRAAGFVVVDVTTMEFKYVDNGSSQAMAQGAGIQAAETAANAGAQVVLTGSVGPKAFNALSAAGINVGQNVGGMTVREAVEKFKNGEVEMADAPNSQGRSGK